MPKPRRIPRPLDDLLRALDDHVHLATEHATRLRAGDVAYLGALATELRTLVCVSSGTEGLLWRLADLTSADDEVDVHAPGKVDTAHPLAQGLTYLFVPIFRAGLGDPRLPAGPISLKDLIKGGDAVVVDGVGYTHESLIKAIAQQMGSAHEDDGLDPHLVELRDTVAGDVGPLTQVLLVDVDLTVEVALRVLKNAAFTRQPRSPTVEPERMPREQLAAPSGTPMPEGSIHFVMRHPDTGWATDDDGYDLGTMRYGGISVGCIKHPTGEIELLIEGIRPLAMVIRSSPPPSNHNDVAVTITWTPTAVAVYLNGAVAASI